MITYGILINGLCRMGVSLRLHEEMLSRNGKFCIYCKPNLICYASIIDLCKDGLVVKAEELFLEMKGAGICPDVVVCGSLMHGLCSMCEWEEA